MATASRRPYAARLPPEERREQLLDAALHVVVRDGFGGITIEAVAREAGVTRPVVYGSFSNLDELLRALFVRCEERAFAGLAGAIPVAPQDGNPDELLAEGVRAFLEAVVSDPETWRVILLPVEGTPAAARERVASVREGLWRQLEGLVAWGVKQRGGLRGVDAELAARAILVVVEDASRLALDDPERFPPERFAAQARALLKAFPARR